MKKRREESENAFLSSVCYFIEQTGGGLFNLWSDLLNMIRFTGDISAAVWDAVRHPSKIRRRETLYYMNMCGPDAFSITVLICLLMGLIMGYQSAVQMHRYGADTFLPALIGCTIVRELGPLMIAIISTGRAGSAFTAEIATMKSSEEINAMIVMGLSPWRFLVIPKLIAMLVMSPILTIFGDLLGIFGGMLVGVFQLDIPVEAYYRSTLDWVAPRFFVESILKSMVFATVITSIACMRGFLAEENSLGVGRATTSSVVTSIILIIVADFMLAGMFNFIFYGV